MFPLSQLKIDDQGKLNPATKSVFWQEEKEDTDVEEEEDQHQELEEEKNEKWTGLAHIRGAARKKAGYEQPVRYAK